MSKTSKKYALISVFDKTGIVELAKTIHEAGFTIISTGGTANVLAENKLPIVPIQQITGNPESFDGRMKTISFQIESGILFDRTNPSHVKQATDLKIPQIDVVVCNLYPFEQTISQKSVKLDDAIENIDVGGPTMIRAAAKNFKNVIVVVDPNDYKKVTEYLLSRHTGRNKATDRISSQDSLGPSGLRNDINRELAAKAFAHISIYDTLIAKYLNDMLFPNELTIAGRKIQDLRYGENPHQKAALFISPNSNSTLQHLKKEWGRDLSATNVTDMNAGIEAVRLFKQTPTAVIIKHNNPCGIALGKTINEALSRAIEADPESAFGGVIVVNKPVDINTAKVVSAFKDERKSNIDILCAPYIEKEALEFLKTIRKSMGIYTTGYYPAETSKKLDIKPFDGGFILQTKDLKIDKNFLSWKTVTKKKPTQSQLKQMEIAWKFISRIKSNAVIVVDKTLPMTRGIGTGQTSRVRSVKIALEQAGKHTQEGILASDSFFPFDDSVKLAAKAGITGIVQQGGSLNDHTSIDAADKAGITMVFTGRRAFWH